MQGEAADGPSNSLRNNPSATSGKAPASCPGQTFFFRAKAAMAIMTTTPKMSSPILP